MVEKYNKAIKTCLLIWNIPENISKLAWTKSFFLWIIFTYKVHNVDDVIPKRMTENVWSTLRLLQKSN